MINYNSIKLFKSAEFNRNFMALFETDGPLYYILKEYPNVPAKGGTMFPEYKDTTYFVHVLNTIYIGGILLENNLLKRGVDITKNSKYIKLFFSAGIYHDFNKLTSDGIWRKEDYKELIDNKKQILAKMLKGYFKESNINEMTEILEQIEYIILNVENQGKDYTNQINVKNKTELNMIADYIDHGDSISSILSQYKDETYISKKILEKFKNLFDRYNLSDIQHLNIIRFNNIHQTLLRNLIIRYTQKFFNDNIIIKSADWIIVNCSYDKNKLRKYIEDELIKEFNDVDKIIKKYSPSGNSIDLTFYRETPIDKNFLEKYMDTHREHLLLYQKFADLNNKYNLKDIFNSWGFDTLNDGRIKYYSETGEVEDTDILFKSLLVKTVILRRMEIELLEESNKSPDYNNEVLVWRKKGINIMDIEKITRKTLLAITYAYLNKDEIDKIYKKTMNNVIDIFNEIRNKNPINNYTETFKRLIDNVFLYNLDIKSKIASKEDLCIQCGGYYNNEKVTRINSFGIKPTSGTGLKVSVIEYGLYDGKICELCRLENLFRREKFNIETPICIQIYTGDYMPNIDTFEILKTLATSLSSSNNNIKIDKNKDDEYIVTLGGKVEIRVMNHHTLYFIERPHDPKPNKNTICEFNLLYNILLFIQKSGFKIKLSSMFISGGPFYYTFKWDSPPGWVKDFELDELRINQIDDGVYFLTLINKISKLGRGEKDIPEIISALMQEKMNIYFQIWNKIVKNKNINNQIKKFLFENNPSKESILKRYEEMFDMEEEKTRIEELAKIACKIDVKKPKTNNENTWIIRTAMEVYERNRLDKTGKLRKNLKDIQQKIGGTLFDLASRRNSYESKELKNACINFGNKFVDFIYDEYGDMPKQAIKRDIISQFGLLYNIYKWEERSGLSKEKKEVE